MTAPPRPRRPLPRRVYWFRRFVVLAVLAVVIGTGYGVVGSLADSWRGSDGPELVTTTGAEVRGTPDPSAGPSGSPTGQPSARPSGSRGASSGAAGSRTKAARASLPGAARYAVPRR